MKTTKEVKISYWAHHLTTIISVTLVLLLIGIIAIIWISADRETRRLKERVELSVVMADSVPSEVTQRLSEKISRQTYAHDVKLITSDQALKNWEAETGENLEELFGVNPLSEEIIFGVTSEYATSDQIGQIKKALSSEEGVDSVTSPDTKMIESMNSNLSRLTLLLAAVAVIMLFISFVLINNTVHLTIYSRRFTIHTMKLVGATNGFIRRPIVLNNMLAGLLSGALGAIVIAMVLGGSESIGMPDLTDYVGWGAYGIVACGLMATGVLLCGLAALISANSYLRKDYEKLFR